MNKTTNKTMRDTFLPLIEEKMAQDESIVFITADFGAPALDKIRANYPKRIINSGIAEQNSINLATGMALNGHKIFVYGIAPFISMRCFEQIRINLAALGQIRDLNVNIISVGAGVSYAMSGPTHHCLEDLSVIKTLPNLEVFSPSDASLCKEYFNRCLDINKPKYLRFDAAALPDLEDNIVNFNFGFRELKQSQNLTFISTGFMSQKLKEILKDRDDVGLIDLYFLNSYNKEELTKILSKAKILVTLEEGFENSGGLDSEINYCFKDKKIINMSFDKKYAFELGSREDIHCCHGVGVDDIKSVIRKYF